ncbi:MAG: hypothetical protein Q9164_002049 [Protoblastenia rupestris]
MRAGKHRATGSNIQKPKPESPLSTKPSTKESTPVAMFSSDERTQTFDPSLTSIIGAMPVNGEWPSILNDEPNPHFMNNTMDLDDSSMQQEHFSKPFSDCGYFQHPSNLSMGPTNLVNQDLFTDRSATSSGSPETRPPTSSTLSSDSSPTPPSMTFPSSCHCDQKILQQLLTLTKIPDVPAAFDTALNQNKQVLNLCHSILNDQSHHHHDMSFVLTLTALIAKVIAVYDAIYKPNYRHSKVPGLYNSISTGHVPSFCDFDMTAEPLDMTLSASAPHTLAPNSPFSSSLSLPAMTSHCSTNLPMSLTMGTYRLERKDEERLKFDIFKIELSKVSALIGAFEQRYCHIGPQKQQEFKYEAKAYGDMVHYLQKRLRVSLETPMGVTASYA